MKEEEIKEKIVVEEDLKDEDIPPPPEPPSADECCGNGCLLCVHDIYEEQLEKYEYLKQQIIKRNLAKQAKRKLLQTTTNNTETSQQQIQSLSIKDNEEDENEDEEDEEDDDYEFDIIVEIQKKQENNDTIKECSNPTSIDKDIKIGVLHGYRKLTSDNSPHTTYHMEIDTITCKDVVYQPGDYISLLCPMDRKDIDKLLKRLNLDFNQLIFIKSSSKSNDLIPKYLPKNEWIKIGDLVMWRLHISFIPPQFFLKQMAEYCTDKSDHDKLVYLSSNAAKSLYNETIVDHHITFTSLLSKFKSFQPPLEFLLLNIPPHKMRQYSISSSPLLSGNHIHITFTLVKYNNNNNNDNNNSTNYGQCTNWMQNQIQKFNDFNNNSTIIQIEIPFKIEKSLHFKLPLGNELKTPIILVSTGTGLAPFRSFLHHRQHLYHIAKKTTDNTSDIIGKCILFFGCRRKDWDLLYHEELKEFERQGIINQLFITFSQPEETKIQQQTTNDNNNNIQPKYITSKIEENGEMLYKLMDTNNAIIYICGNSNKIGKSSVISFLNIIDSFKNHNDNSTNQQILDQWKKESRFLMDVWV